MKIRYYPKISFIVFIGVLVLSAATICRAEEITLTTYYPSPYGVYSEMRLYPKISAVCNDQQEGLMFYNNTIHQLMVCGQDSGGGPIWQPISGLWARNDLNLYPNDDAWNVGIGKSNPGTKLDVAGTVRATDFTCVDCLGPADIGDGLGVNEINEAVIQQRVWEACGSGSSMRIIKQDGSVECEVDDTGGGPGNVTIGSLTVTGGGSLSPTNPWNPGSGVDATLDIAGGPGGSVFSLAGGSGITLSGPGVSGNTWNPNAGTATISATGSGPGAVTPSFSPICDPGQGNDGICIVGSPGQFSFCALSYHRENTGGGGDKASCRVYLEGTQWKIEARTSGGNTFVKCQAVCF